MKGYWTCQRSSGGVKCGHRNPNRKRNCEWCKKPRPVRKPPAHMSALSLPYEYYLEINGGPQCGICGKLPAPGSGSIATMNTRASATHAAFCAFRATCS
jgi:hypothetical protein